MSRYDVNGVDVKIWCKYGVDMLRYDVNGVDRM